MGMGRGPVEKPKDFSGTLKRLLTYLMPMKYRFVAVFLLAIGSTTFNIVGPKVMGRGTDKLTDGIMAKVSYLIQYYYVMSSHPTQSAIDAVKNTPIPMFDMGYIGRIMMILIGLYILSAALSFVTGYLMSGVAQSIVFNMRSQIKAKLDLLPLKYYDGRTHGEILSRMTNDMDNIANTLQQSLTQLVTSVTTLVGILIMMLSISPLMTLIAVATLPLSLIFSMLVIKNSQRFYAAQQKTLGELNGHVEEMYTGHKVVKVFGHEKESIAEFREVNNRLFNVGWRAQFVSGMVMPALNFVGNLGYVLICIVGGILVTHKTIKVGDVQAFISYMRQFSQPIVQTANIANVL